MGKDKRVESVDRYEQGGKYWVDIETLDGWMYRFYRLTQNEPFQMKHKRRPDGTQSHDEHIVPIPIETYFDEHPELEVVAQTVCKDSKVDADIHRPNIEKVCTNCDHPNRRHNSRCSNCGSPLP